MLVFCPKCPSHFCVFAVSLTKFFCGVKIRSNTFRKFILLYLWSRSSWPKYTLESKVQTENIQSNLDQGQNVINNRKK